MRWLLLLISILLVLTAAAVAPDAAQTAKPSNVAKAKPAESESKTQMSAAELRKTADEYYKQCQKFRLEMGSSAGR